MQNIRNIIDEYVRDAKTHLAAGGQEEALKTPLVNLFKKYGEISNRKIVLHGEYSEKSARPDFGMHIDSALCGHIELKKPGTSLDPSTFNVKSHNYKQWQNLKELPNLLYTNGTEFRLWRYGEPIGEPATINIKNLRTAPKVFEYSKNLDELIFNFTHWEPSSITNTKNSSA